LEKYRSQEVASNKLEKGPLRDYETDVCSPVALMVLEKKILFFFSNFFCSENFLGVKVSVKKMFQEKLIPDAYAYQMP
jgi:hypothetical protein